MYRAVSRERNVLMTNKVEKLSIASLAARLQLLEDQNAILRTLHLYGQMVDLGLDREWSELFMQDGVFLCVDQAGEVIIREQGRDALAAWVRGFEAVETRKMKHLVIAPVISIDGDEARVVSQFANLVEHEDPYQPPHVRFMGQYIDDMQRDRDGVWRFRQRKSETGAPLVA